MDTMLNGFGVAAESIIGYMPNLDQHLAAILRETNHSQLFWAAMAQAEIRKSTLALITILDRKGNEPGRPDSPGDPNIMATRCMIMLADELATRTGEWQNATRNLITEFEQMYPAGS
jgi:hypothetical protein